MTNPPRHYFLNEGHELAHAEKEGGGGTPKFGSIDWAQRGRLLARSLTSARDSIQKLPDPTVTDRLFLLAKPVQAIPKLSDNQTKYPSGRYDQKPDFSGEDSLAFRRLGIDLVDVGPTGDAVVHVPTPELGCGGSADVIFPAHATGPANTSGDCAAAQEGAAVLGHRRGTRNQPHVGQQAAHDVANQAHAEAAEARRGQQVAAAANRAGVQGVGA